MVLYDRDFRHKRMNGTMSQNGQTYFENLAAFGAEFLKCVRSFWDIMHSVIGNSKLMSRIS